MQNVQNVLFGEDKRWSHKTRRSHIRESFFAGTTVLFWHVFVDKQTSKSHETIEVPYEPQQNKNKKAVVAVHYLKAVS